MPVRAIISSKGGLAGGPLLLLPNAQIKKRAAAGAHLSLEVQSGFF